MDEKFAAMIDMGLDEIIKKNKENKPTKIRSDERNQNGGSRRAGGGGGGGRTGGGGGRARGGGNRGVDDKNEGAREMVRKTRQVRTFLVPSPVRHN